MKMYKSFAHIFIKSGSVYLKPRPKWSAAHSTLHILSNTFHQRKRFW